MARRRYVLVTLCRHSWGRAELALRIARAIRARGDEVHLLVTRSLGPLVREAGCTFTEVHDQAGALAPMLLKALVVERRATCVLHCDLVNNLDFVARAGVAPERLLIDGVRTIQVDVWDLNRTGIVADVFGDERRALVYGDSAVALRTLKQVPARLIPSPIVSPVEAPERFASLPARRRSSARERRPVPLGLSSRDRLVLFCTARWQHRLTRHPKARAVAQLLPRVLVHYFRRLSPRVVLAHVGPAPLAAAVRADLGARYRWLGQLGVQDFDAVLARTHLHVSANASATVIGKALVQEVPTLLLDGSDDRDQDGAPVVALSPPLRRIVGSARPLYPFWLWPLGCRRFLSPVLADNPLLQAVLALGWLDEEAVVDAMDRTLFDPGAADDLRQRQQRYVRRVRALPGPADALERSLHEGPFPAMCAGLGPT